MKSQKVLLVIGVALLAYTSSVLAMMHGPTTKPPPSQEKSQPEFKKQTGKTQPSRDRNSKSVTPTVPVNKNR